MESSTARRVSATTIAEAFRNTVERKPDEVAVRTKGDAVAITWSELRERVDKLAAGLAGLGLKKGETVALMFSNRPEFHIADLAVMMVGGTPFSIYNTYSPEQIEYVVGDAGSKIIVCEQAFLPQILEA